MKKIQSKAKRSSLGGQVSDTEIADLQEILLKAILLSQPLPGSEKPIRLPDLGFFLNQPSIKLMNENMAESISKMGFPKSLELISRSAAIKDAHAHGDIAYLYFHPAEVRDNEVELTLAGRIIPQDPRNGELGLSSIRVKFRKTNGQWLAVEEPIYSAA